MSRDEPNDVPPPHTEEDQHRLRSRVEGLFRDVVRRTVHSGVNTALQTEESLRSIVGDIRLPREVVGYLLQQIDNTKRELVHIAAREFREFLDSANIGEELAKILTTLSFEIRTEVRFIPNDQALRPNVSSRVSIRNRESGETLSEEEGAGGLDDVIREAASEFAGRFAQGVGRKAAAPSGARPEPSTAPPGDAGPKGRAPATGEKAPARPETAGRSNAPQPGADKGKGGEKSAAAGAAQSATSTAKPGTDGQDTESAARPRERKRTARRRPAAKKGAED